MNEELVKQIQDLLVRAQSKDTEALQQLQQIKQAAEQGDPKASQLWQMVQQVAQAMQNQQATPSAAKGSKLNYIKELKGICPEGYLKQGGRCKPCEAKKGKTLNPIEQFREQRKNKK